MKRRTILAAAAAAAALPARAAAPLKVAILSGNTKAVADPGIQQVLDEIARRGWRAGQEIEVEVRYGDQLPERLPALAHELALLKPAVIVAFSSTVVQAVKNETRTVPVVMISSTDPVASGFVASFARPGGNITGTMWNPLEIAGKAVDVLKTASPGIARITVVWNPDAPGMSAYKPFADRAAAQLKVALSYAEVRTAADFHAEAILATRPQGLYVVTDPVVAPMTTELIQLAREHRLPSISFTREFTQGGGMFALAPDFRELAQNVADHVDRILRGASPASLPVRVPTHFEFTINLKTARAVGLAVPRGLLSQASEVVD